MKMILLLCVLLSTSIAFAMDKSSGCGIGWAIAPKNSLFSSSIRSTTNSIFCNNTFGMTFGTVGCAKHTIVLNEKRGVHFAEANFHQLMIDMAKGEGEYLNGFAEVVGYNGDVALFGQMMQANYARIFPNANVTPDEMYQNFANMM